MMAQMTFRLTYRKSQYQVAFPLDTYRLLVQYPGLQFGHQLLHVVQALGQRADKKLVGYSTRGVKAWRGIRKMNKNWVRTQTQTQSPATRILLHTPFGSRVFTEAQAT